MTRIDLGCRCGRLILADLRAETTDVEQMVARAMLSPSERDFFERLKGDARRCEWIAARALAREEFDRNIDHLPSGRPILSPFDADNHHISLSHTDLRVALLASRDGLCGVDIECATRDVDRLVHKFASPAELALASELYSANAPLVVWCAKEVVYKIADVAGLDFRRDMTVTGVDLPRKTLTAEWRMEGALSQGSITLEFILHDDLMIIAGGL